MDTWDPRTDEDAQSYFKELEKNFSALMALRRNENQMDAEDYKRLHTFILMQFTHAYAEIYDIISHG